LSSLHRISSIHTYSESAFNFGGCRPYFFLASSRPTNFVILTISSFLTHPYDVILLRNPRHLANWYARVPQQNPIAKSLCLLYFLAFIHSSTLPKNTLTLFNSLMNYFKLTHPLASLASHHPPSLRNPHSCGLYLHHLATGTRSFQPSSHTLSRDAEPQRFRVELRNALALLIF